MIRPLLLAACMIALCSPPLRAAQPEAKTQGVKLVELYTSEACSSCLPADAAFVRLAADADVIALGFHVAYWNYLGSADPFALGIADRRQWIYAHRWHSGEVFTPQMIVDGTISGTGDNGSEIAGMMRRAKTLPWIGLSLEKGQIVAEIPALPHPAGDALWIVTFDRSRTVAVKSGENVGHTIHEVDIVRFAAPVATLQTTPQRVTVPLRSIETHDGVASFVQEPKGGPVAAAGRMYLDQPLEAPAGPPIKSP